MTTYSTLPMSGSCRIRVDGAGTTLHWRITPEGDHYAMRVWEDGDPDHWGHYVGTLADMRRIASTQGARGRRVPPVVEFAGWSTPGVAL